MRNVKKALAVAGLALMTILLTATSALAAGEPVADNNKGYIALAIGIGLGLAAFGGSLGQGKTASAALEGISRNPGAADKIFTPMILGLALIESLVIYSFVIGFVLSGKM